MILAFTSSGLFFKTHTVKLSFPRNSRKFKHEKISQCDSVNNGIK